MNFKELVGQEWEYVEIFLNGDKMQIKNDPAPRSSERGWTYVYEMYEPDNEPRVIYVGNTKENGFWKRINPELNHSDVLNGLKLLTISTARNLQNTNMRLTRILHDLCMMENAYVRLYFINVLNCQIKYHPNNNIIDGTISFGIDKIVLSQDLRLSKVISWLPSIVQGIDNDKSRDVALEKCLLLKHAIKEDKLPRANLGFR